MIPCPRAQFWLQRVDDPRVKMAMGCRAYACPACGSYKVRERVRLAAWGASLATWCTHLTLTQCPEEWQRCRGKVRDFFRRVRKAGNELEAAWSRERNPEDTGYHIHALCHGTYIEHSLLQRMWDKHVWITPVEHDVPRYIAKTFRVAGYGVKAMKEVMSLNGGRAIHTTRGYLHGMTARGALRLMAKYKWRRVAATEEEIAAWREEYLTGQPFPGKVIPGAV